MQGLNILVGYTGQISLGHAAFMAVGAYSSAIFTRELGFPFWISLPFAAIVTGFTGLLFGLPSLRVKGFYLAMATLAAQFIIPWVLRYPLEQYTNGARPLNVPAPIIGPFFTSESAEVTVTVDGEPTVTTIEAGGRIIVDHIRVELVGRGALPTLQIADETTGDVIVEGNLLDFSDDFLEYEASKESTYVITATYEDEEATGDYTMLITRRQAISFASDYAMYYIIIPLAVFLMLAARNIIRTRVGRAFISVRDNDLAAELLGINVFTYKLQAFFLSAVYAGIAGALFAAETNSLSLQAFQLDRSIEFLAMLIVGGAGFPLGSMFGAGFFTLINEFVIPNITTTLRETLPDLLTFIEPVNIQASINPILFGTILIVFLILEPRGIAYRWEILKVAWKIRPYSQN